MIYNFIVVSKWSNDAQRAIKIVKPFVGNLLFLTETFLVGIYFTTYYNIVLGFFKAGIGNGAGAGAGFCGNFPSLSPSPCFAKILHEIFGIPAVPAGVYNIFGKILNFGVNTLKFKAK